MIISVHIPKTAGSSFRDYLQHNNKEAFLPDYGDPILVPPIIRNGYAHLSSLMLKQKDYSNIKVIHGHFLPYKYKYVAQKYDVKYITWMRHPMARLVSHYDFFRQNYHKEVASPLHRKMVQQNWSLEKFMLAKEMRNLYSKFLYQFPKEKFDFIGITEYFEKELSYFAKTYFNDDDPRIIQGNRAKIIKIPRNLDLHFMKKVEKFHQKDYDLYQYALEQFNKRS